MGIFDWTQSSVKETSEKPQKESLAPHEELDDFFNEKGQNLRKQMTKKTDEEKDESSDHKPSESKKSNNLLSPEDAPDFDKSLAEKIKSNASDFKESVFGHDSSKETEKEDDSKESEKEYDLDKLKDRFTGSVDNARSKVADSLGTLQDNIEPPHPEPEPETLGDKVNDVTSTIKEKTVSAFSNDDKSNDENAKEEEQKESDKEYDVEKLKERFTDSTDNARSWVADQVGAAKETVAPNDKEDEEEQEEKGFVNGVKSAVGDKIEQIRSDGSDDKDQK